MDPGTSRGLPARVYVPIVLVAGIVFVGVIAYLLRIGLAVEGSALGPGATAPAASQSSIEPVATRAPGEVAVPQSGGALPNAGAGALPGNGVGGGGPAQTGAAQGGPPAPVARLLGDLKARLAKNPRDLSALVALAGLYLEVNKFAQAEPLYARALAIDPDNPDTRTDYAAVLHGENKDLEALRQTATALAKRHDFAPALFEEAVVASAIGRRTQAIEAFRRFLQVAPNDPHADDARAALNNLGAS